MISCAFVVARERRPKTRPRSEALSSSETIAWRERRGGGQRASDGVIFTAQQERRSHRKRRKGLIRGRGKGKRGEKSWPHNATIEQAAANMIEKREGKLCVRAYEPHVKCAQTRARESAQARASSERESDGGK
eukprot:4539906-Pleurochrysis_carterae.AAC.1